MKKQIKDAKVAKEFLVFIRDAAIKAGYYHKIQDNKDELTLSSLYNKVAMKSDFAQNLWYLLTEDQKAKICKALGVKASNFDLNSYLSSSKNANGVLNTISKYIPVKATQTLYMFYKESIDE